MRTMLKESIKRLAAHSVRLVAFLFAIGAFSTAWAATYTWTGGGTDNNWTTPENWGLTEGYPNAADAEVTFPAGDAVTVTGESSVHTGVMTINCDVTLTGSFTLDTITDATITSEAPDGTYTVTLDTVELAQGTGFSITAPVVVANTVKNTSNGTPTFNKAVSGSGTISNSATGGSAWCGFIFKGDCSNFTGTYTGGTRASYSRDCTELYGSGTTSASATYTIGNKNGTSAFKTSGTADNVVTYAFGTLYGGAVSTLSGLSYANLQIGALNGDSTLYVTVPGSNNSVTKVGTGSLTLTATLPLTLSAGSVTLVDPSYMPTAIAMADGTTLGFSTNVEFSTSFITPAGAATIDVASGNSVTLADTFSDLTKTGDGILTLTAVPTGTITVSAGYVYLPSDAEPTLDTDTTGSVSTTAGLMLFNKSAVNVWTGEAEDNTWATAGNWSKEAAPSAATDVVIIPEGADISITCDTASNCRTGVLTINRNVTLVGNGKTMTIDSVSGSGTLAVNAGSGKIFYFSAGSPATINCDLEVYNTLNAGSSVYNVYGAIKGSGYIKFGNSNQPGFHIYGDVSEFTGSYDGGSRDNGDRDGTRFLTEIDSEDGAWTIGNDYGSNYHSPFRAGDGATYKFGILNTHAYSSGYNRLDMFVTHTSTSDTYAKNATIQIGSRENGESSVGGTLYNGTTGDTTAPNKIVKVGDTSTLNLRLTASEGAVEVEAGTVNLVYLSSTTTTDEETQEETTTYTAYAPVVTTITGTNGVLVADSAVAALEGFAPVLSEELAETYVLGSTTDETTGAVTYQLANVCTVGGVGYKTLDEAKAALTEENDTIVITAATPSKLTVNVGESIKVDNPNSLTWGGIAWPANGYVEDVSSEGTVTTYTAIDNTASTWTNGGGDNLWSTAANWSTGYVPDSGTVVTLPEGAAIYTGTAGTAGYCGGMVVNGAVSIAYDANMGNYTAIQCNGDITGAGTLTLARAGINGNNKAITISANLAIENDTAAYATSGHDSYVQDGTFTINGDVTVNGLFLTYASTTFNGAVTVADGGTITSYSGSAPTFNGAVTMTGQSGIYTYAVTYNGAVTMGDDAVISVGSTSQTYGSGFVLNGSGTWIGDTQLPASTLQTNLCGNNNNTWTGVCELKGYSNTGWGINVDLYGSSNSTVRLRGVTAGAIGTGNATYNTNIELADTGLILNGDYSRNSTFSGKLSGSGALTVTKVGGSGSNIYFTGDVSEFTGSIALNSSNTASVTFGSTSTGSGERIVIPVGVSVTIGSGSTWTTDNIIVLGDLTVSGALAVNDGSIWGSGTSGNRTIRFTTTTSGVTAAKFASSWNGTCVVDVAATSALDLNSFGNTNTTVVLASDFDSKGYFTEGQTITPTVRLDADVTIRNGSARTEENKSEKLVTFTKLTGGAGKTLTTFATSNVNAYMWYAITTLDEFEGSLALSNRSYMDIGTVNVATAPVAGTCVVPITVGEVGGVTGDLNLTVAGAASTDKLVFATVGETSGLYLAVASVDGTYYATLQDAVDAAGANTVTLLVDGQSATLTGGTSVKIAKGEYDCTINAPAGYSISDSTDDGVTTYTTAANVASVTHGETVTPCTTLAAAIAAAADGDTVTLLAEVTEAIEYTGTAAFTIDLNGCSWTVDADCDAVWAAFKNNGGTVTFKDSVGTGEMRCDAGFVIWARLGSVVIESGNYVNDSNDNYTIYAGTNDAGLNGATPATVTITGGTFVNENSEAYIYKTTWHSINLNVFNYDATKATQMATTLIQVSGGTFTWDPALGDDNMGGSFVADGYTSYEDTEGVWTVEKTRLFKHHLSPYTIYTSVEDAIAGSNGALLDQLESIDEIALGTDESLSILADSTKSIGKVTFNGGTLFFDVNYAGVLGDIEVGSAGGTLQVCGTSSWGADKKLTGAGDLTIEFLNASKGMRLYGDCEGYSGTLTLKSAQTSSWARGFMSGAKTSAAMSFAVDSGDATSLVDFVAKFEGNATFNAMSTTANSVTALGGKSITLAGAGASAFNGTLTNGSITKSGTGVLTLGSTFAATDNLTLNVGNGSFAVAATAEQLAANGVEVPELALGFASGVTLVVPETEADTIVLLAAKSITGADSLSVPGWTVSTPPRTLNEGTEAEASVVILKLERQSGIMPASGVLSTTVVVAGEPTDAEVWAATTLTAPAGVTFGEGDNYKDYFTYTVTPNVGGSYTVAVTGVSEDLVVEPVEISAIAALQSEAVGGQVTVTVKPGLYYGFVSGDSPVLDDPAEYTLATGTSMTFAKPSGTGKGFVKVVISPAPKE